MSERRVIRAGDAELCVETIGDAAHPAVLLISGMAASMDWWDDELCGRLAGAGRHVIRYDHRDTGQSTSYPAGAPGYSGRELTTDAVAVLDGLGVPRAHVVGVSMGGAIAQELGAEFPDRVLSLTLIGTSPVDRGDAALPPPVPRLAAQFTDPPPEPDWADREAAIEAIVQAERDYAGSIPADEPRLRALAGRVYDRTRDMAATQRNHAAAEDDEHEHGDRLAAIAAPTLVLHGTEDPLFPLGHGEALAARIPGARLIVLEGMGHQVPPPELWDVVVPALVAHTAAQ
jgi:pimeloyl-ACP methyl ester carboxylesterase